MISKSVLAHPARGILAIRRISVRQAAATIGVSEQFLGRCLLGHVPPSQRVRDGLSRLLNVPTSDLFFDQQAFDRSYGERASK